MHPTSVWTASSSFHTATTQVHSLHHQIVGMYLRGWIKQHRIYIYVLSTHMKFTITTQWLPRSQLPAKTARRIVNQGYAFVSENDLHDARYSIVYETIWCSNLLQGNRRWHYDHFTSVWEIQDLWFFSMHTNTTWILVHHHLDTSTIKPSGKSIPMTS